MMHSGDQYRAKQDILWNAQDQRWYPHREGEFDMRGILPVTKGTILIVATVLQGSGGPNPVDLVMLTYGYGDTPERRVFTVRDVHEYLEPVSKEAMATIEISRAEWIEMQNHALALDRIDGQFKKLVQPIHDLLLELANRVVRPRSWKTAEDDE